MKNQSPIRCTIYTREALALKSDHASKCISMQLLTCEAFIADNKVKGWVLDSTIYCDSGFSGMNGKRPKLTQLLDEAKQGNLDIIVIESFDRLARCPQLLATIIKRLQFYKVKLISISDYDNSMSPEEKTQLKMKMARSLKPMCALLA